ncbi:MAG TPA: long-chain fatty acid--CoA ligase [Bacteroidales bacterium]|nr:long-chain fatty acid--CoA ligase [Bacteroidales bacterium]
MIKRIFDILENYKVSFPEKGDVFAVKNNGEWIFISLNDYYNTSRYISIGLLSLGLKPSDTVLSIFTNNLPQWNFIDMGILQIGAVHVSVHPTLSENDLRYVLKEINPGLLFVSDEKAYQTIVPFLKDTLKNKHIYMIENSADERSFNQLIDLGKQNSEKFDKQLTALKNGVSEDQLATIIYTSGTTGLPKGVMLSHQNIVSNVLSASKLQPLRANDKILSFLPLCHVYERTANYQFQFHGTSIYYSDGVKSLTQDMMTVKPDGITTIPRLLEKVLININLKSSGIHGIKKRIFSWSMKFGYRHDPVKKHHLIYRLKLLIANKLVFDKWKKMLGGNLRYIGCGGASIDQRIERIFWAAGIPVFQGYGLTECSPLVALNRMPLSEMMIGTVGPLIENVDVMISPEGEVLCRGPNMMKGYFKQEGLTKKTIVNGWLHTGDLGLMINGKYLKITGRKKEMFKTSYGKYIVPSVLENKLNQSVLVEQAMAVGEGKPYAAVIISPNFEYLYQWLAKRNIYPESNCDLISLKVVNQLFEDEIQNINKELGKYERIMQFRLIPEVWGTGSGELSVSLKIKRTYLAEKYKSLIQSIYQEECF